MKLTITKTLQWISYLTILMAISLMGTFFYWMIYPYKTIRFNTPLIEIVNEGKTVKSGGYLILKLDFCKYSTVIPEVSRTFFDQMAYNLAPAPASTKPLGCQVMNLQLYVPKALPADTYTIRSTYVYKVNPIRNVTVSIETEKFTIK